MSDSAPLNADQEQTYKRHSQAHVFSRHTRVDLLCKPNVDENMLATPPAAPPPPVTVPEWWLWCKWLSAWRDRMDVPPAPIMLAQLDGPVGGPRDIPCIPGV